MNKISFFSNTTFVFFAFALSKFSYVLAIPALTKNLSQTQYGIWIQLWVTVSLMIPVASLCVNIAAVRYLAGIKDNTEAGKIIFSMLLILAVSLVFISVFFIAFSPFLSNLIFSSPAFMSLIHIMVIWLITKVVTLFFFSILRAFGEFKKFGLLMLFDGAFLLIAAYTVVPLTKKIESMLHMLIILEGLLSVIAFLWAKKYISFIPAGWRQIKNILYYSLPLVPNTALAWITNASDRFLITHIIGLEENGIYSVTYTISNILSFLFIPLGVVLFPVICNYWNQDIENKTEKISNYIEQTIYYTLLIAIPMIIVIFCLWPSIVLLFSNERYLTNRLLFLVISVGIMFEGINLINGYILQLENKTITIMLISGIGSILNLGLNFILIPKYSLMGAAIATLISYFFMAIITILIAKKIISYLIPWRKLILCLLISITIGIYLWIIKPVLIVGIFLGIISYLLLITIFRLIGKKEIDMLKVFMSSGRFFH